MDNLISLRVAYQTAHETGGNEGWGYWATFADAEGNESEESGEINGIGRDDDKIVDALRARVQTYAKWDDGSMSYSDGGEGSYTWTRD